MDTEQIILDARHRGDLDDSDDFLYLWMNQEYDEINLAISRIEPDYFLTSASLSIVAGTSVYNLPADFLRGLAIDDENGVPVDKVSKADPNGPEGWYYFGQVIETAVRYERIKIQDTPSSAKTWTLSYVYSPPELDADTNTILHWPRGFGELLVLGILLRAMEPEDDPDRYKLYAAKRDAKRAELLEIVAGRSAGLPDQPITTHTEDYE